MCWSEAHRVTEDFRNDLNQTVVAGYQYVQGCKNNAQQAGVHFTEKHYSQHVNIQVSCQSSQEGKSQKNTKNPRGTSLQTSVSCP